MDNPASSSENKDTSFSFDRGRGITYSALDESLLMNKYHLLWILERMQKKRWPTGEYVLTPFGMMLAFLLALLPTDFQDYLGIKAAVWESLAIGGFLVTLALTIIFGFMWAINCWKYPPKKSEQIYDDIIEQMKKDKERISTPSEISNYDATNS